MCDPLSLQDELENTILRAAYKVFSNYLKLALESVGVEQRVQLMGTRNKS